MAVSKVTRRSNSGTNQVLKEIFRGSQVSTDRQQEWERALGHAETGDPPLRFPVYEPLYQVYVHAQKLVDALRAVSGRVLIDQTWSVYPQSLVQYVRAAATRNILGTMTDIEHTESWLFQTQQRREEKKFIDPDDVYFHVRDREAERIELGLPPRIQFLDETAAAKPSTKTTTPRKPS